MPPTESVLSLSPRLHNATRNEQVARWGPMLHPHGWWVERHKWRDKPEPTAGEPPSQGATPQGAAKVGLTTRMGGEGGIRLLVEALVTQKSRVAVVGSSGTLLYRGNGPRIEEHDVIIRVNGPILSGYEKDVGHRTHVRLVYGGASWGGFGDAVKRDVVSRDEVVVFTQNHIGWASTIDKAAATRRLPKLLAVSNHWMATLSAETLGCGDACVPSTGFQALAIAVAVTRLVGAPAPTVFGFGACVPCVKFCACPPSRAVPVPFVISLPSEHASCLRMPFRTSASLPSLSSILQAAPCLA